MLASLAEVSCASFSWSHVPALAPVRNLPDVTLARIGDRAWVRWQAGNERILEQVLSLPGVILFLHRDSHWCRFGCQLPAFDVPLPADYQPLHQVLIPDSFQTEKPPGLELKPTELALVRDDRPRPTTASLCSLPQLASWIEQVPTPRLNGIQAAHYGNQALLLGDRLPLLPDSERFWGSAILTPLGYRPDPFLPESALREALAISEDKLVLWRQDGVETVDSRAFAPLTRAGVRLAAQESH
jgi:hypothetical protein